MRSYIIDPTRRNRSPEERRSSLDAAKMQLAMNPAKDLSGGINAVAAALMARKKAPGGNVLSGLFALGQKGALY